ncbi:MAG: hypothetical protein WAX85_01265 [Minisyncoccia bacterium]
MKKYLFVSLVIILIIPSVTFAAWWNPFTWSIFQRAPKVEVQKTEQVSTTTAPKDNSEIDALKQEIADLKNQVNQPKPETKKVTTTTKPPVTTKVAETPKVTVTPTVSVSVSKNPASQCLATKDSWNSFIKIKNDVDTKLLALISSYNKSAWGTGNKPSEVIAQFSYNYERMNPAKTKFFSDADAIDKVIDTIPQPPVSSNTILDQIKKNFNNSVASYRSAYELTLSSFKVIADDDNGLSKAEIDTTLSLLNDGSDKFKEGSSNWNLNNPFFDTNDYRSLKKALNSQYSSNGCAFTFFSNDTIETTIPEEYNFTQQMPKSNANSDGSATVSIATTLPIETDVGGTNKTVLKLICNGGELPVSQIDPKTVGIHISKNNYNLECHFTYTGNGNTLSTRMLYFNY